MKKLSLAYFGSSYFSALFLEKLVLDKEFKKILDLKLVVTQPDKPVGRKQILTATPVKKTALNYGVEIIEIENLKLNKNLELKIKNLDFCLLFAFGGIVPQDLLNLPNYGFINVHPSLLPKYRGTSPIATPLINGDKITGVTIIKMDEKIDHGPVITQDKYDILPTDKRPDLEIKLTNLGFELFRSVILPARQSSGEGGNMTKDLPIKTTPQNHSLATYTKKLSKQDGFVDFKNLKLKIENSSEELCNLFRGLYPWPGIWTIIPDGRRLKITDMEMKNGKLSINKVQLEGKNEVNFETFNKAYKIF